MMGQLDLESGSRTSDLTLHQYKSTFSYSGVYESAQFVAVPESTRDLMVWRGRIRNKSILIQHQKAKNKKQKTKTKPSKLHILELSFLQIRNKRPHMTSFFTALSYKCLFIMLMLSSVEGTFEFSAWRSRRRRILSALCLCFPWPTQASRTAHLSKPTLELSMSSPGRNTAWFPRPLGKNGDSD